jgi:transcriptional regulator with PAS, ATPase and Fis domain
MGRKIQGFTNAAIDRLVAYEWSGNVRELENEIERTVALAGTAEAISVDMLSEHIRGAPPALNVAPEAFAGDVSLSEAVDALKRNMILAALAETGSKTRAAERLGVPRQSLQKMMKRLELTDT